MKYKKLYKIVNLRLWKKKFFWNFLKVRGRKIGPLSTLGGQGLGPKRGGPSPLGFNSENIEVGMLWFYLKVCEMIKENNLRSVNELGMQCMLMGRHKRWQTDIYRNAPPPKLPVLPSFSRFSLKTSVFLSLRGRLGNLDQNWDVYMSRDCLERFGDN